MTQDFNPYRVFLQRVEQDAFYEICQREILKEKAELLYLIERLAEPILPDNIRDKRVVVKPNLLKAKDKLCVTSWQVIACVSFLLKSRGAQVSVADSPAFGNAAQVLKGLDLHGFFSKIGASYASLSNPVRVRLPSGIQVSISRNALEADLIVNLPRLKAHCQMGVTGAVKNLFGSVPGFRKALYHVLYGRNPSRFSRLIIEIGEILPETVSIMDAACCMHGTGPTGGTALWLGVLGSSRSSHALDTAFYSAMGANPSNIPIWQESQRLGAKGAFVEYLEFPWLSPSDIKEEAESFRLPTRLDPITFSPIRFLRGRIRSFVTGSRTRK